MKNNTLVHLGLAILRVVPSVFMITHGYPKLMKLINGNTEFANPFGIGQAPSLFLAVVGEFICPLLIIIGFKTCHTCGHNHVCCRFYDSQCRPIRNKGKSFALPYRICGYYVIGTW